MCGGVVFTDNEQERVVYFPQPRAVLPVKLDGSAISKLLTWGRRQGEAGELPFGGWARYESIQKGVWDKYFPKPVKLSVKRFMEKDHEGVSHWYDVTNGQWIQGLLARYDQEYRVYVVTITPERADAVHDRWPRIVAG